MTDTEIIISSDVIITKVETRGRKKLNIPIEDVKLKRHAYYVANKEKFTHKETCPLCNRVYVKQYLALHLEQFCRSKVI